MNTKECVHRSFVAAAVAMFFLISLFTPFLAYSDVGVVEDSTSTTVSTTSEQTTIVEEEAPASDQVADTTPQPYRTDWFDKLRGKLKSKHLQITPRYRQEYILDSNILLESTDGKTDSIFREMPGIDIQIPFKNHSFALSYDAALQQFIKFSRENNNNQYFNTALDLNFKDIYIHAHEGFAHTYDRSGTTLTEIVPRNENKADAQVGYRWNRFTTEVGYENFWRHFNAVSFHQYNYMANKLTSFIYADLTTKTQLYANYNFTRYVYENDGDRNSNQNALNGGIRSKLLPKTSFYAQFGYSAMDVSHVRNGHDFVSGVGASYTPFSKTAIDLGYQRSQEQAVFSDLPFFLQNFFFLRLTQQFTQKISGVSNIAYTRQAYDQPAVAVPGTAAATRNDELFTYDIKLIYKFTDWFSADIKYQFNRRSSNLSVFDYTDNLMALGAEIKL
ncbi:MAG: outer membrane beta-barrel protein [Candidatus Omnitrophica bacterium]|nr:outer membrane beta-barrel protein [Candidatus Omnitrophota bacterium]